MKQHVFIILILVFLSSCSTVNDFLLMKKGKVVQKDFKEVIPITLKGDHVIIEVKIKGQYLNFLLDTGAPNVISLEAANRLKLSTKKSSDVRDSEERVSKVGYLKLDTLSVGNLDFINTGVAITDLNKSESINCMRIDGILGANLMQKAVWAIDSKKEIVTVASSMEILGVSTKVTPVSFKPSFGRSPHIKVMCNGEEVSLLIDTGSDGLITMPASTFEKVSDENTSSMFGFGSKGSGLSGQLSEDTVRHAIISNFSIGEHDLNRQMIKFYRESDRVGMEFLKNYIVVFDWFEKEMTLIPNTKEITTSINSYGFSYVLTENSLVVSFIYNNSSAEIAGLKIGDQIIEVNGTKYDEISRDRYCEVIYSEILQIGGPLSVSVMRGDEKLTFDVNTTTLLE